MAEQKRFVKSGNSDKHLDNGEVKSIIKKNGLYDIYIEDINEEGAGIGKVEGFPLFVKDSLIGDCVRVKVIKLKKNYGFGRVETVLEASKDRVMAACTVARACGGCQIQEMNYEAQLKFKENKIRKNLERIGNFKDFELLPIIGMEEPFRYRNKAQFPIARNKEGKIITGFYAGRTHFVIENDDCILGDKVNYSILSIVKDYMDKFGIEPYSEENHVGLVRHVLIRKSKVTAEIMVCLIINGNKLKHSEVLVEELLKINGMTSISYNINRNIGNVILGEEVVSLYGNGFITDKIAGIMYQISPLSFYQVNSVQTEKLYSTVLEFAGLSGGEIVWDLYCGIGSISLFLAQKAKHVYGVEVVPQAINDAKRNAKINGIDNVTFMVGKAEEVLPQMYDKDKVYAEVIVVDPPRKGCDIVALNTMVKMKPKKIVYVSCDSATLARDLRYLCDRGYELTLVKGVDMFPMTVHVETVVLMSRKDG
jgi:23S rRNA (uracil-5-)-methyltransferase RumA